MRCAAGHTNESTMVKDVKHLFASLYLVDAGLVLSHMQRLVVKSFPLQPHDYLIAPLLLLCQSHSELLLFTDADDWMLELCKAPSSDRWC